MYISNLKKILEEISKNKIASLTLISMAFVFPTISRRFALGLPLLFVWATLAMSYDIILGFCGIPSFGHAAPFGIGVFTSAILLSRGYPLVIAILAAAFTGMFINMAMSLPCYRVKGIYYAILTLAIAEMIHILISNIAKTTVAITTGTPPELVNIINLWLFGIIIVILCSFSTLAYIKNTITTKNRRIKVLKTIIYLLFSLTLIYGTYKYFRDLTQLFFEETLSYPKLVRKLIPLNRYYYTLIIMLISYIVLYRILKSPLGTIFIAIRENPERAEIIGYNVFRYIVFSFAISGFFAGLSGASYMICIPTATLEVLTSDKTFIALLGAVIGGLGTLTGPLFGGMLVGLLRDYLSKITPSIHKILPFLSIQQLQLLPTVILGLIYIAIVMLLPFGILGTWYFKGSKIKRKIKMILTGREWR